MCGIVAIIPCRDEIVRFELLGKTRRVFKEMMILSQRRGHAASGMFLSHTGHYRENKVTTIRTPLKAEDLMNSVRGEAMLNGYTNHTNFMVGHTRAATGNAGPKDNRNNHPHVCGDIIGVHNGKVEDEPIWKKLQGFSAPRGECDSEAIFAYINHLKKSKGTRGGVCHALKLLKGWYALALMDTTSPSKIYIVKDKRSDLSYVWWKEASCYLVASEKEIIEKACKTAGIKLEEDIIEVKPDCVYEIDTHFLYRGKPSINKLYLSASNNDEYIEKNKEEYEKTQGR